MNEKINELKEDVAGELIAIEETVMRLTQIRVEFQSVKENYTFEPAIGTYLMNFYNGIENVLKRISKSYYTISVLKSPQWHKELLDLSFQPPKGKAAVFSPEVVEQCCSTRRGYPECGRCDGYDSCCHPLPARLLARRFRVHRKDPVAACRVRAVRRYRS